MWLTLAEDGSALMKHPALNVVYVHHLKDYVIIIIRSYLLFTLHLTGTLKHKEFHVRRE